MLPVTALGPHVRRQRLLLDLTQEQLARDARVSQSLIAKLERGRLNPSYESVRLILDALDRHERRQEPTARELMHPDPVAARPGEKVGTALARMKENGFSQLPVLAGKRPIGQISESAVLRRIEAGSSLQAIRALHVRDVMGEAMPAIGPETRRGVLVELLRDAPAVLVVQEGDVIGVVTKPDLW